MFDTPQRRAYLRAAVAATLAGITAAAAIFIDNVALQIASAVFVSFAGYLGIGAASGTVEPNFGRKLEG